LICGYIFDLISLASTNSYGIPAVLAKKYLVETLFLCWVKKGQKYGEKFFYKWWRKACQNLNIENVDLYGGTRHSSTVALRDHFSPEQIKEGTMHQTNKAFERYYRVGADDIRSIYEITSNHKNTTRKQAVK